MANESSEKMSDFTPKEIEYLQSHRLGRLATVNPKGRPQNAPVRYFYNPQLDTLDIGGRTMSRTQKFRNVLTNPFVAFVVDDVSAGQIHGVEVRGTARTLPEGGKAIFGPDFDGDESILRITPLQIIGWGLDTDPYEQNNRKVGPGQPESPKRRKKGKP